jgi:hypothetical protein
MQKASGEIVSDVYMQKTYITKNFFISSVLTMKCPPDLTSTPEPDKQFKVTGYMHAETYIRRDADLLGF